MITIGGYCKDCRWWSHYDEMVVTSLNGGFCNTIRNVEKSPKFAKAIIGHGKQKDSILSTAHDFACIQWAPHLDLET